MLKYAGEHLKTLEIVARVYKREYSVNFNIQKDKLIFAELMDIARISRKNNKFEISLQILKKAFDFNYDTAFVLEELDELFIAWGDPEKALDFYHELERGLSGTKDVFLRLSRQYKILRDYENVRKYYHKVLDLDPDCEEAKKGGVKS